ncbi:protein import receptor MAS20 [Hesseltinella vesiculosa]|uniref:Protein import receptor MAS20 n=1 Tax=Hesseltinella vesiculosa TaxID=101127 RepID=A0A1X2GB32_9FUNG|nr:protein import receptor MAS20 [Hesseltinella vesiculosa]
MNNRSVALYAAGAAAVVGVSFLFYFDYKRRNNPDFRRKLKRDRKKAAKLAKQTEEDDKQTMIKLIEHVIVSAAREQYPKTPEEMEKFFMTQVAEGESLCAQGEAHYNDAVLPFYKALKVYPAPEELLQIYQKTLPEAVFSIVMNILAIEQQAREAQGGADIPIE